LFRTRREFDAARGAVLDGGSDDEQQVLTPAECLALEPALRLDVNELAGGIFTASEQVGDCAAFCAALTERMRRHSNIEWLLGTPVVGPVQSSRRLCAVETTKGRVQADRFVL
jgi:D-amino-acid dehydrogenase